MKTGARILLFVVGLCLTPPAEAGILNGTVHDSTIDFCFVGDAVTSRPDDVKFILRHLRMFENHGHLSYRLMANQGQCPAPSQTPDGRLDVHPGDLRIGVPGTLDLDGQTPITGLALGKGCGDPGTTLWWGDFPVNLDVPQFRACRLNTYLRDGMALNKILHEIGHTIGLSHEHERTDMPLTDPMVKTCFDDVDGFGKGVSQGNGFVLVTPYDRDSVMHYEINDPTTSPCNLGNDNGSTGLSAQDQLTIRILYPHESRVAEYMGATVVQRGQKMVLRNQWGALGALVNNVVKTSTWSVKQGSNLITQQAGHDFAFTFQTEGDLRIEYTFQDILGRTFSNVIPIRVISAAGFQQKIVAPLAARSALM